MSIYEYKKKCCDLLYPANEANNEISEDEETVTEAAINGHLECLKQLVPSKFDANFQDSNTYSLLQYAAACGYVDCMKYLLSCGANVNLLDKKKESPLHDAVYYGKADCAVELIKHGADFTLLNNKGYTPRNIATWLNREDYDQSLIILRGRAKCKAYFEQLEWKGVLLSDVEEQLKEIRIVHKETVEKLKDDMAKCKEEVETNRKVMLLEMAEIQKKLDTALELLRFL